MKMKKRKFGHADSMALQSLFNRVDKDWSPTLEQIISMAGLGNVNQKQVIEWLEYENKSYVKL